MSKWGLGVYAGTRPESEAFRATGEIIGLISQKPLLKKESGGGSCGITAPGKCSLGEPYSDAVQWFEKKNSLIKQLLT